MARMTDARRSDGDISFNCTCCRTQQPQNRLDQSSLTPSQASRRANCQSTRQYRFRTVVIQDRTVSLRMPSIGAVSPLGARHASMTPQRFAAEIARTPTRPGRNPPRFNLRLTNAGSQQPLDQQRHPQNFGGWRPHQGCGFELVYPLRPNRQEAAPQPSWLWADVR